jgi:formamidopyrimidine-DNA glycosylase
MPELPEVETIARTLSPVLTGKTFLSVKLRWPRTLAAPSPVTFKKRLIGQRIESVSRRAKFLHLHLSDFHLILHLRMSGDLLVVLGGYQPGKHDRLIARLSEDASLVFTDTRKFGRIWLVKDPETVFGGLGPEPLSQDFNPDWLHPALHKRHRQLKPLLLDQSFLAGLGNIYVDEALHLAKLHPLSRSDTVTRKQANALWQAIRSVLQEGIRRNGASIDWVYRGGDFQNHFRVYGRTGERCPECKGTIKRILVGQRSTHYCPRCQVRAKSKNPVK